MNKKNLRLGFVILIIYEIIYWLFVALFQPYGSYTSSDEEYNQFLWSIVVPISVIIIYLLWKWATQKNT